MPNSTTHQLRLGAAAVALDGNPPAEVVPLRGGVRAAVSVSKCTMVSRRRAPRTRRMPISFVRSVIAARRLRPEIRRGWS